MNRITLILTVFIITIVPCFCQSDYFQQQVNSKIDLTLNDATHTLEANIQIEYINNSRDTLDKIYIHVWPNAYKNRSSEFAKEKVHKSSRAFHFSRPEDRGYISNLNFKENNEAVKWEFDKVHEDIVLIKLNKKLAPGKKLMLSTPFTLKIPKVYSRLGHDKQDYYMTQWFPKPAVYDKNGWHPIPYLDQGEFYSEFGDYEVNITLPENYIIGATGERESKSDGNFVEERIKLTKQLINKEIKSEDFIGKASSKTMKTVSFRASKVHDFAWFASKDFLVSKDAAVLNDGSIIPTYGYYTTSSIINWKKSAFYVKRAVEYYSDRIGNYPWPQASAVFGDLKAGGGMEYPMITIINVKGDAQAVDNVITHEVGHNWFYGILASNERDNPWMDEGINTFYEEAYMEKYYPNKNEERLSVAAFDFTTKNISKIFHLRKLDQPLNLSSAQYAPINYGLDVYNKAARYIKILEEYQSKKVFDKAMKAYYAKWAFRHPGPKDLREVLEYETGKELNWLFDNLIEKNQMVDYSFKKNGKSFLIFENKTNNPVPIPISFYKNKEFLTTKWVEGFKGTSDVKLDLLEADKIIIDDKDQIFDVNKNNNIYLEKGLFHYRRPVRLRFAGLFESNTYEHINLLPVIGWNNCDKTMLGLGIYSTPFPGHAFRYYLLPMYSFAGKNLVGQARIEQNFYSYNTIERFTIGVFAKSYTNSINTKLDQRYRYTKIAPYVSVEIGRWKNWAHKLTYTPNFIYNEKPAFTLQGDFGGKHSDLSLIHTLDYDISNSNRALKNNTRIRLEQQTYNSNQHYIKLTLDTRYKLYYSEKKSFDIRFFAGGFLENTQRYSGTYNYDEFTRGSMSLASTGHDDYLYEGSYIGRTAQSGFFSRQIDISDGGMKFAGAHNNGTFGFTNSFLTSLNLKCSLPFDLPYNIPLKPYFDAGYSLNSSKLINLGTNKIVWSGGFMFDFWNVLGFYFPVVNSRELENQYSKSFGDNYLKRISFSIQIPVLRITEILKQVSLD